MNDGPVAHHGPAHGVLGPRARLPAALGRPAVDTARLRHVAHLAFRALPHTFAVAGEEPPAPLEGLALVLTGPGGDEWRFGTGGAVAVVAGRPGIGAGRRPRAGSAPRRR